MSIESRGIQFTPEKPTTTPEISQVERDLNEIIPILAHGLVRRIEQKGFSGKVRVQAIAGDTWGVAKSPENPTDIPNVIIYPRESLSGDKRLTNARLRHEIGNLNYPIDSELNDLRGWCYENEVAPELLTSLVKAIHEASVNFLEMRNSHSSNPEDNFRVLYEQEINTQQIADSIPQSAPYKQAVDLTLLYSLSQTGLVPTEQFEQALGTAHSAVQEIFDKTIRLTLVQSIKIAVPKKQVQLVRDYLWPKFSGLVALSGPAESDKGKIETGKDSTTRIQQKESSPEAQARAEKAKELQEKIQQMMQKMRQQAKTGKKQSPEKPNKQREESPKRQEQQLSPAEKQERKEEENLLAQNLQEQLQQAKEKLEQLQKPGTKSETPKPQKEQSSMQEISKQAELMRQEAEKAMQEAKESGVQDEVTEEQLQKLKEQLEQLEEVAKQIAESGALEEELAKPEEEPIIYNIKEFGINEAELTPEQLETLQKTRTFAQGTSKVYRTAMRLLMKGYQERNPKFTDNIIQKMMERGFDVPDFSIYGSQAGQEFLSQREELGIDNFSDNFLVNFQLPKPLARFWYKGGNGSKSVPVKEGEIEWGYFYRMCMPIIYNGVDRSQMSGLYLNRLNSFGQHDPKQYYYLWESMGMNLEDEDQANESDENESEKDENNEQGEGQNESQSGEGQEQGSESQEGGESGSGEQGSESGQGGESGGEGGSQGGQQSGEMGGEGGEPGGMESGSGGMPSAQEMQEFLQQMQDMLNQAKEQGGSGQEAIDQLLEQLSQMQESLESGASPQEMAGQMQDAMQQLSEAMSGMQGEGQGEGQRDFGEHEPSTEKQSGGQIDEHGFEKSKIENEASPNDPNHRGGAGNTVEGEGVTFSRPDPSLLAQLRNTETLIGSKFTQQDESGNFVEKEVASEQVAQVSREQLAEIERKSTEQLSNLEELKRQHEAKVQAMYKEMSGLNGEALRKYIEYMEAMKGLINDLTDFFIEKFDLDRDYIYERNQRRGARLQRGYTKNVMGMKDGRLVMNPRSFERKRTPEMPQFVWTIIIDNTGSVGGMIEDEKKLAVSLIEITKRLNIPFEIVIYTEGGYQFLKTFEQEGFGEDLQKVVLLQASIGNQQDTDLLRAAYASQTRYANKFKRAHKFIFFLTDGLACSTDSLNDLVNKFKKETVILGIGLAEGAGSIKKEFGKNALEVPDSKQLSTKVIRKVEELIYQIFD